MWPFLLGLFDPESTPEQRQQHLKHKAEEYQELLLRCQVRVSVLCYDVYAVRVSSGPMWQGRNVYWHDLCCSLEEVTLVVNYPAGLHVMLAMPNQWDNHVLNLSCVLLISQHAQVTGIIPVLPQALEAALKESLVNAPAAAAANNTSSSTRPSTPSRPSPPTATSSSTPSSPTRAAAAAQLLPEQVVQFAEAHRIIVIDAVRTDFRKHAIAPIDGSSYGNVQLPDQTSVSHWLHGWLGAQSSNGSSSQPKLWISEATQQVLDNSPHLSNDSKRQAVRLIALLSAYAVHDPETGYCQG